MKYRRLGASELMVSEIGLGSWLTYGAGVERRTAQACVSRALELGINFFDTANIYENGAAEAFLGDALREVDRSKYILATKLYFPMSFWDRGLSAKQVRKQLDASLRRLKTDYVDLYQCHRYDRWTRLEETMGALTEAVKEGKARYFGFSEWSARQIRRSLTVKDVKRFVSSQPQYSMLWREPEKEVFPLCAANGIGQVVWSPLAQGILTGKYKAGEAFPADSRAASSSMGIYLRNHTRKRRTLERVQLLRPIAASLGITLPQLALAWVLRTPQVSSAIVGASRPEQVEDNAGASGVGLSAEVLRQIEDALEGSSL